MCFQILNKFISNKELKIDEIIFLDIELELSLGNKSEIIKQKFFKLFRSNKFKLVFWRNTTIRKLRYVY